MDDLDLLKACLVEGGRPDLAEQVYLGRTGQFNMRLQTPGDEHFVWKAAQLYRQHHGYGPWCFSCWETARCNRSTFATDKGCEHAVQAEGGPDPVAEAVAPPVPGTERPPVRRAH